MKTNSIFSIILLLPLLFVSCTTSDTTSENGEDDQPEYNPAVQRDKLIVEYLFDGNAEDTSGNGNDGVVSGATLVSDRFGRSNHAYQFVSAESDEIVCADAPELNPTDALSVTLWIRPTAFDVNGRMISKRGSDGASEEGGWEIDIWDNRIRFTRHGTVMQSYSTDTLTVDEWIFVGFTMIDGEQHMYVNGSSVGSTSEDMYVVSIVDFIIGRVASSSSLYFSGDIDDVRLGRRCRLCQPG